MILVVRYNSERRDEWNEFIDFKSSSGVFFFRREYMEYHSERFKDHSLMFYFKDELIAVLSANRDGETLRSHGGLSFGGFQICQRVTTIIMLRLFDELVIYARRNGFKWLEYKPTPWIYHDYPAGADEYALYLKNAELTKRSPSTVIAGLSERPIPPQEMRLRNSQKALNHGIAVRETEREWSNYWRRYWDVLTETLESRHGVKPVHTLNEMKHLKEVCPENIWLHVAVQDADTEIEKIVAGAVFYESRNVVRAQYIASNEIGRKTGALDLLFYDAINDLYHRHKYFDFGISTEFGEMKDRTVMVLNEGLIFQKEGFGGRSVNYDTYTLWLE